MDPNWTGHEDETLFIQICLVIRLSDEINIEILNKTTTLPLY